MFRRGIGKHLVNSDIILDDFGSSINLERILHDSHGAERKMRSALSHNVGLPGYIPPEFLAKDHPSI
jgi:hypothetical protein